MRDASAGSDWMERTSDEHRRFPRFRPDDRRPVELQLPVLDHRNWMRVQDLSEGGAAVETPLELGDFDLVGASPVIVSLPGRLPFKASVRLRHLHGRPGGRLVCGFQFTDLPTAGRRELRNYLSECGRASA